MTEDPRRFYLDRRADVTGASGTGRVADGTLWPDGTATVRWRGDRPSTVTWDRMADAEAIHGHGGATRIVWLDATGYPPSPSPKYSDAWRELTGYVQEAVNDGGQINPVDMLSHMAELHRTALAPIREWMKSRDYPEETQTSPEED